MSERRGTRALETWCRRMTDGYPGVKVENMTTSWRDGLAFCAIIHHFRPDLIDFTKLNKDDVYYNNALAFRLAERHLGIPALLDAEDMVEYEVPDRLSILTYLSQFYQVLAVTQASPTRLVAKRPQVTTVSSTSSSPPTKMAAQRSIDVTGSSANTSALGRREPCAKCALPVFLAERLNVASKLYHRTCFRCARCNNQLSLANCYETEDEQFCCETCPDEEEETSAKIAKFDSSIGVYNHFDADKIDSAENQSQFDSFRQKFDSSGTKIDSSARKSDSSVRKSDSSPLKLDPVLSANRLKYFGIKEENEQKFDSSLRQSLVRNRSLSDEEKSKGLQQFDDNNDEYSATFENALEENEERTSYEDDSLLSKARNTFLTSHLLNEDEAIKGGSNSYKDTSNTFKDTSNTAKDTSNTIKDTTTSIKEPSNIIKEPTNTIQDPSNTITDQSNSIKDQSISIKDSTNSIKDISNSIKDISNSIKDTSNTIQDQSNTIKDQSNFIKDSTNSIKDSTNSIKDISNTTKDTSNAIKDPSNTIKDIPNSASNIAEMATKATSTNTSDSIEEELSNSDIDSIKERTNLSEEPPPPLPQTKPPDKLPSLASPTVNIPVNTLSTTNNIQTASFCPVDQQPATTTTDSFTKDETNNSNKRSLVKSRMLIFETGDSPKLADNVDNKTSVVAKYFLNNNNNNNNNDKMADVTVPSTKKFVETNISILNDKSTNDTEEPPAASSGGKEAQGKSSESFTEIPSKPVPKTRNFEPLPLTQELSSSPSKPIPKSRLIEDLSSITQEESAKFTQQQRTDEAFEDAPSTAEAPAADEASSVVLDESQFRSILSSDDTIDNSDYLTLRSDLNCSDSLVIDSSCISENSSSNEAATNNNYSKILTKSLFENLSDQTPVSINSSILNVTEPEYPEDLNPFGADEETAEFGKKKLLIISKEDLHKLQLSPTPSPRRKKKEHRKSNNPFDSDEDVDEILEKKPPLPTRKENRKVLEAPRVSLNPFWSDDEAEEEEEKRNKPVPLPRSTMSLGTPEPRPRKSNLSNNSERYDSNSSLSSMYSTMSHTPGRKKKPAPPPPPPSSQSPQNSKHTSPCSSTQPSPKSTPRLRKNRKAPLPPSSTPFIQKKAPETPLLTVSPIESDKPVIITPETTPGFTTPTGSITEELEREKNTKDEKNRNRQSQSLSSPVSDTESISALDKSTHGRWKRKKGPAPSRPVPQRRQIKPLPLTELRRELDIIEMQQQGLEKQGVKLEQLIREKCEGPEASEETALSPEVEDLVLELFELVNEKNELFRRQAELMYLRRQQRLEEEHADLEYQIRCLMERPERNKTDSDKAREEELINRLVEVVERRSEIVECLEMDRVREAEEDHSINTRLCSFASKRDEDASVVPTGLETPVKLSKKEKKKMKKEKKLKDKGHACDIDKDIDESETSMSSLNSAKKKKKKWFLH